MSMNPGDNTVYVQVIGDAENLAKSLQDVVPNADAATVAIEKLNTAAQELVSQGKGAGAVENIMATMFPTASVEEIHASVNKAFDDITEKIITANSEAQKLDATSETTGNNISQSFGEVGSNAVLAFRDAVSNAVSILQVMQDQLGSINATEAKTALTSLGFDSATVNQAISQMNLLKESAIQTSAALTETTQTTSTAMITMIDDLRDTGTQFDATGEKKDAFKLNIAGLGDMMRYVRLTAFMLFMAALNVIRQMFQDAIKDANEFSQAIFGLDVAVRAYQRDGFDVSLKEVHDQIAAIQKLYPYFDMTDMDNAMAKLINSTREFGVTSQQAFQLYGDAAKIATLNNTTMEVAVDKLMTAVTSGAHAQQALRGLGIAINGDLELAFEKEWDALDASTSKLTLQEKAAAALGLVHKYLALTANDVANADDVLGNKTKDLSTAWKNFLTVLGTDFAPLLKNFYDGIIGLIDAYQSWIFFSNFSTLSIVSAFTVIGIALDQLVTKHKVDFDELKRLWKEGEDVAVAEAKATAFGNADVLPNAKVGTPEAPAGTGADMATVMADAKTKIEKIEEDLVNNLEKLWTDYNRDLDQITLDGQRKQEDLFLNYERDIQKIAADLEINLEKEDRSFQDSQLANEVSYQDDVAKAKEKQQQQIIDDEKKFQDKIAQLRFDLENSLEDAIAARDARQITRLIRAEQAAEQSAKIAYDNEKRDRDEKFSQELDDLKKQEDDRQKALEVAHQIRLREINIQNQEELDAALVKLKQQTDDLNKNLDQQRADRKVKYDQDKSDLLTATGKLVADLTTSLTDQYNLTAENLTQLYALYDSYYGPDGSLLSMMRSFYAAIGSIGSGGDGGGGGGGGGGRGRVMASGGIGIANKATSVTFGEAGLEAAIFMPLNGSRMSGLGSFSNMSSGGQGNKTVVEVWLSPDLQARIVNQAQSGIVDIFVKELG